ncbi:MAG: glycosyltransferase family 2 protein [Clostridium sp.]|uniref:glycosyltransferase family 2 protein n=1 Tax=Clostridium sp. TaxID=1506 RepID=UPI003F35EED2
MKEAKEKISVIVPCYNEEESIPLFYEEIIKLAEDMSYVDFEFIFINDGSKDKSILEMRRLSELDNRVRYVSFSRNFGKEAAMYAGLQNSIGDYAVIIDVDLQHPPRLIKEMYERIQNEGCDCVATKRRNRDGEPKIRSFFSRNFYKLINKISDTTISEGATDYRLMKRKMVNAILDITEYNRFSKGIFEWVGFDTKWIAIDNEERKVGTTTWSFWSLLRYSMEGFLAYSTKPLLISSLLGILLCILAVIYAIYIAVKACVIGDIGTGWPTIVCLVLFLSGIQLFCIGILGQYLAKTYLETKKRPIYIVKETEKED